MIYLADRDHLYTMDVYLADPAGRDLARGTTTLGYQDLARPRALPGGTWIFTDHERFTERRTAFAGALWDRLATAPGTRLLNHPSRVLRRFDLLRALHERGFNRFAARRADDSLAGLRYPVFLRREDEHSGSLTPLLRDGTEVRRAIARVGGFLRDHPRKRLLVVEYCHVADEHGVFRKYSCYRVGDRFVPRSLNHGTHWVTKAGNQELRDETIAAEREYMETHPHEGWMREVFDLAGIEYGRIDYGVLEGRPQAWEINTNPMIVVGRVSPDHTYAVTDDSVQARRRPNMDLFHRRFQEALREVDTTPGPGIDWRPPFAIGLGYRLGETGARVEAGYCRIRDGGKRTTRALLRRAGISASPSS